MDKNHSVLKEIIAHGEYPMDGGTWRRVKSISEEEAQVLLPPDTTLLNKGFWVFGYDLPKESSNNILGMAMGTQAGIPQADGWSTGTRAVYLHDFNYSIIEAI